MDELTAPDVREGRDTIHDLLAEFRDLTPLVEATKQGTPHEGHQGWSLGGEPYLPRCACGDPMTWLVSPPLDT